MKNVKVESPVFGYVVKLKSANPLVEIWLADHPEWDGSIRTNLISRARVYKTSRGAQRWLDARPEAKGEVVPVYNSPVIFATGALWPREAA